MRFRRYVCNKLRYFFLLRKKIKPKSDCTYHFLNEINRGKKVNTIRFGFDLTQDLENNSPRVCYKNLAKIAAPLMPADTPRENKNDAILFCICDINFNSVFTVSEMKTLLR